MIEEDSQWTHQLKRQRMVIIFILAPILYDWIVFGSTRNLTTGAFTSKARKPLLRRVDQMTNWEMISDKLCPSMIPQSTKYARHPLFDLAQKEILQNNISSNIPTDWATTKSFRLSIWKCANTQIRRFEDGIFDKTNTVPFQFRRTTKTRKSQSKSKNKHYKLYDCIVAAIRDPISHFLSGYNEIEWRINEELKNPRESIAKEWPFGSLIPGSMERFDQFVADLVTCPIGKNLPGIVDKHPRNLEIEHVYSMSAILRLLDKDTYIPKSRVNFHYLPTLANLNETWAPFVLSSCPRAFSNETRTKLLTTPMRPERWHESTKDQLGTYKVAKAAMKKEGPTAKALCALHLMDYACWQDLPDGVPKVCMDLYLDYHKRGLLL
ncbi:unnamed protein product [Cylindrotheca closterium]|uniref:Uncharacterized protein n=1 Tax=Cylindrotheca closterium TaxID=2856 RepID=A0AAD2G1V7_9STRA|nr:unnamed protein product [Cylindrotheca closterium]